VVYQGHRATVGLLDRPVQQAPPDHRDPRVLAVQQALTVQRDPLDQPAPQVQQALPVQRAPLGQPALQVEQALPAQRGPLDQPAPQVRPVLPVLPVRRDRLDRPGQWAPQVAAMVLRIFMP
jgi:hypothetical protein